MSKFGLLTVADFQWHILHMDAFPDIFKLADAVYICLSLKQTLIRFTIRDLSRALGRTLH